LKKNGSMGRHSPMVIDTRTPPAVSPVDTENHYRCSMPQCNHLLFKGKLAPGSAIEIKCSECKMVHSIIEL
jgi:hypothetical protein